MIEFGSRPRRWKKTPMPATESNKAEALSWLRKLKANGSTQMHRAVLEALRPLRPRTQRQVVLITDGYIGFEKEIVKTLLNELPAGARLHTVGVGSSVNRSLTEAAARAGRGTELIVGVDEEVERLVGRLLARTTAPLVTDMVIEGAAVIEVAPVQIPDLYAEAPAIIATRVDPDGGEVILRGTTASGHFEQRFTIPKLELGAGPASVAALFGREKVRDLETALTAGGDPAEINASIEATGIEFQISTRLTSWIAVSKQATVEAQARLTVEQPHELPHGVSATGLGLRTPLRGSPYREARLASRSAAPPASMMAGSSSLADVAFSITEDEDEDDYDAFASLDAAPSAPMDRAKRRVRPDADMRLTRDGAFLGGQEEEPEKLRAKQEHPMTRTGTSHMSDKESAERLELSFQRSVSGGRSRLFWLLVLVVLIVLALWAAGAIGG
jgi:Ca-activated chloride channel family protein